jgi:hypothetical protein
MTDIRKYDENNSTDAVDKSEFCMCIRKTLVLNTGLIGTLTECQTITP